VAAGSIKSLVRFHARIDIPGDDRRSLLSAQWSGEESSHFSMFAGQLPGKPVEPRICAAIFDGSF
jgi:hypothetical protein